MLSTSVGPLAAQARINASVNRVNTVARLAAMADGTSSLRGYWLGKLVALRIRHARMMGGAS